MHRLASAGLIQQESRGNGKKESNTYRLLPLSKLDLDHAKAILEEPLTLKNLPATESVASTATIIDMSATGSVAKVSARRRHA